MKKKLFVDVDDVIVKEVYLEAVNNYLGTSYVIDQFTNYYIDDIIGSEDDIKKFYDCILDKNIYKKHHIAEGCVEVLKELSKKYDVYICSSCYVKRCNDCGPFFMHKFQFLTENFPFLDPEKFIFTSSKDVIKGDIFIDDRLDNLRGDIKQKLLFTAYHNKNIPDSEIKKEGAIRVDSWKEIAEILL